MGTKRKHIEERPLQPEKRKMDTENSATDDQDSEQLAEGFLNSINVNSSATHTSTSTEPENGQMHPARALLIGGSKEFDQLESTPKALDMEPKQDVAPTPELERSDPKRSKSGETQPDHNVWPPKLPEVKDSALETQAFTHRSAVGHDDIVKGKDLDYERLEFLGDSFLYPMCARLVYEHFPSATAGKLSTYRENLLRNESLAEWSKLYGFDKKLNIEKGTLHTMKSAGKPWTKLLGDTFEAYVAAIILSRPEDGWATTEQWLRALWLSKLPGKQSAKPKNLPPKDELGVKILSRGIKLTYEETKPRRHTGPGRQEFSIGVFLEGWGHARKMLGSGKGSSKAEAGAVAAKEALKNPLTEKIQFVKKTYEGLRREEVAREGGPRPEVLEALEKRWK